MQSRGTTFWIVVVGLAVSLLLHGTVLVPALTAVMQADSRGGMFRARFNPSDFREPDQAMPPDEVQLGLEDSDVSTMTWIGYEDYQQHMAALAEVEQAAFTTAPTGAEAGAPAASPPQDRPQDPAEAQQTPPDSQSPQAQPTPTQPAPADPDADPLQQLETWLAADRTGPGPPEGAPENPAGASPAEAVLDRIEALMEQQQQQQQPQPAEAARAAAQTPPQPQQPQQPQPAGEPGQTSDQESDPFSTVEVSIDQLNLGRPLAAHGLQVKPVKPVLTALTRLTAAPANPLLELRFRSDGRPGAVRLVQGSGDGRIDEAIINCAYRWRAAGRRLGELQRGQTIPIRIRLVLVDRR